MKTKGVLVRIYKSAGSKIACMLLCSFTFQLVYPTAALALTSGPAQPEFTSFEPASTTDMVDIYSGDFTYNIPLMAVPGPNGGYPINLAYHAGITMEQEASWVGLGWTLNTGAVNRQMRGVPDDFKGDIIKHDYHLRPDRTVGFELPTIQTNPSSLDHDEYEKAGFPYSSTPSGAAKNITFVPQVYFNTYRGLGERFTISGLSIGNENVSLGCSVSFDSQSGIGISPNLSFNRTFKDKTYTLGINTTINNRNGLQSLNFTNSVSKVTTERIHEEGYTRGRSWDIWYNATNVESGKSSQLSFATSTFVPSVTMPVKSFSVPFSLYVNMTNSSPVFTWFHADFDKQLIIKGYYAQNSRKKTTAIETPAYGYLNTEESSSPEDMLDFQPGDFEPSKKHPYVAPGTYTHDVFMLTGQGAGGMFRAHRSGVDALHVPEVKQKNFSLGVEFEAGQKTVTTVVTTHLGFDFDFYQSTSTTGDWQDGTSAVSSNLHGDANSEFDHEKSYFKMYGEHTGDYYDNGAAGVDDHWANWKEDKPLRLKLDVNGLWVDDRFEMSTDLSGSESQSPVDISLSGDDDISFKNTRQRRTNVVHKFTNKAAEIYGYEKNMSFKTWNGSTWGNTAFSFSGNHQKDHHLSEISDLQPDGTTYVYGLPVYNMSHIDVNTSVPDVNFSTSGSNKYFVNADEGSYEDDIAGSGGAETRQFLDRTELPEYVSSWLLTSVRGADYVDVKDDGITNDDLGYWTKLSYYKPYSDFKWRTPYRGAIFNNGCEDTDVDNTAYYSYGTKECFYINKIETKTHVAVFYISKRKDGCEAAGEDADDADWDESIGTTSYAERQSYKLDSIKLYVRDQYEANGDAAVCIQGVHFRYDYSLCPSVYNNDGQAIDYKGGNPSTSGLPNINSGGGKLTLTKIFFTYQNSRRGEQSPYVFDYSATNPQYNPLHVDRWGNYFAYEDMYENSSSGLVHYPFLEFPYTPQTENSSGVYEHQANYSAWTLDEITLPTGGKITLQYEADDYAYVEDQPASQMLDLVKWDPNTSTLTGDDRNVQTPVTHSIDNSVAQDLGDGGSDKDYYWLYVQLDKPVSTTQHPNEAAWVRDTLLGGKKQIWFKVNIPLRAGTERNYVTGYAPLAEAGGTTSLSTLYGVTGPNNDIVYFAVKAVDLNGYGLGMGNTHPFRKAAYQYLKLNRPELVHNISEPNGTWQSYVGSIFNTLLNNVADLGQILFGGYYQFCQVKNFSETINLNGQSIVRFYEPDGRKYGGGCRVKSLKLNDNWINSSNDANYGQEYFYDTKGDGSGTSTGVAYEPAIGGEESSLRQPIEYIESDFASTPYTLFLETPLMDQYYPGPQVGYSMVTVKSIAPTEADTDGNVIENTAAPFMVHEFYTPKDFPVLVDETDVNTDPSIIRPVLIPGIYTSTAVRQAKSQGYTIELNDMAGKMKKVSTYKRFPGHKYNLSENLIASQELIYRTKNTYNSSIKNELDNRVQVLTDDNSYRTAVLGQTFDVFMARNENNESSFSLGLQLNFEFQTPVQFLFVPIARIQRTETSMKTVVTHKVIHRSGILKETVITTDQSRISTENLAYDINTGGALLTKVTNEFKDPIYNFSYPAHWAYDNMGGAYKNIGVDLRDEIVSYSNTNGYFYFGSGSPNAAELLVRGDYVYARWGNDSYVLNVFTLTGQDATLIDKNGLPAPETGIPDEFIVIQSGRKNMLEGSVGSISSMSLTGLTNAYTANGTYNVQNSVLNAAAIEFHDEWRVNCFDCGEEGSIGFGESYDYNPFRIGLKNIWRPKRSYAFVTDRLYADNNKTDGYYDEFEQFNWADPGASDDKWISASTITRFSPFGFEIENKDALGIYSAAHYGYNSSMITAIGKNTRYPEMFAEDFETIESCPEEFFWSDAPTTNSGAAHTGKKSLKVNAGATFTNTITFNANTLDTECEEANLISDDLRSEILEQCGCQGKFTLEPDKEYYVSMWAKEYVPSTVYTNYTNAEVNIKFYNSSSVQVGSTVVLDPTGKIIEGWQRMEGKITVPSTAASCTIEFKNTSGGASVYYDDFRIHPYKSNMISYVYDLVTYRLMAELDAQNYATLYVYDEAGHLNKIKKETKEGRKTIKEGRISNHKH